MKKIPNTFGIDVTAARFLEYGSEDELRELIAAGQVVCALAAYRWREQPALY